MLVAQILQLPSRNEAPSSKNLSRLLFRLSGSTQTSRMQLGPNSRLQTFLLQRFRLPGLIMSQLLGVQSVLVLTQKENVLSCVTTLTRLPVNR